MDCTRTFSTDWGPVEVWRAFAVRKDALKQSAVTLCLMGNPDLKKGLRGRFGMYVPPLMEKLGLADLTHDPKGNKMRSK